LFARGTGEAEDMRRNKRPGQRCPPEERHGNPENWPVPGDRWTCQKKEIEGSWVPVVNDRARVKDDAGKEAWKRGGPKAMSDATKPQPWKKKKRNPSGKG